MTCHTACSSECACFDRGVASGRRTVEAEFAAERDVLAMLVASLTDAAGGMQLRAHPLDAVYFEGVDTLLVNIDPALPRGTVHFGNDTGALPRAA